MVFTPVRNELENLGYEFIQTALRKILVTEGVPIAVVTDIVISF